MPWAFCRPRLLRLLRPVRSRRRTVALGGPSSEPFVDFGLNPGDPAAADTKRDWFGKLAGLHLSPQVVATIIDPFFRSEPIERDELHSRNSRGRASEIPAAEPL
jgi:hypothetical protein